MSSNARDDLRAGLFKCVESGLQRIENLWAAIGFSEEQRCERMKVVFEQTQDLFSTLCDEEETLKNDIKLKIDQYRDEATSLFSELDLEPDMPAPGSLALVNMEQCLRTKLESLDKEKYTRLKTYKCAKESEESLCETLGLQAGEERPRTPVGIPSVEFLEKLKERVHMLEEEKERRVATYCTIQESILQLWKELEKEPQNDFEISIASFGAESFLLSDNNLERIQDLCQELQKEFDNLEHTAVSLRNTVVSMWQRLNIPEDERIEFTKNCQGCKPAIIKKLRRELERLEEIKRLNMRSFINATRDELKRVWDACMFGVEQRQEFAMINSDETTDAVLDAHECEVQRVKELYENTKDLYELVKKRRTMFTRYLELRDNANNPDKFKNRGGRLLREQTERKMLQKEIPKLEKGLKTQITEWESAQQQYFIVNDWRYLDTITSDWKQLKEDKERAKVDRRKQKELQMEEETMYGSKPATTPLKRKATGPVSASPACKVSKLAHKSTPLLAHSSLQSPRVRSKRAAAAAAISKMTGPRTPNRTAALQAARRKIAMDQNFSVNDTTQERAKVDSSISSHGTYTDFTRILNKPESAMLRSSIISNKKD